MAKFKNIKKFSGNGVPVISPAKPRVYKKAPEVVRPIIPLATVTPEPVEVSRVERVIRKPQVVAKSIVEPRPAVPKTSTKKFSARPKKIGTFVTILFFTIALQIVLLVSILYLSPSLIH